MIVSINENIKIASVALLEIKREKNPGGQRYSNTWPLRYRCSALPTELRRPTHCEQVNLFVE